MSPSLSRLAAVPNAVRAAALVVAALLPAAAARGEIERAPEFKQRVNAAIDRGAEWLLGQQSADGGWTPHPNYPCGTTALAYHTLRVCGVPADDARMKRAFRALRAEYRDAERRGQLRTYTAALLMMALEDHAREREGDRASLAGAERAWMAELVDFLERNQSANGAWRYASQDRGRGGAPHEDYDHSNTQYALLGLRAASRSGVEVERTTYARALRHLLDAQEPSGPEVRRVERGPRGTTFSAGTDQARGWSYLSAAPEGATTDRREPRRPRPPAYGSMTVGCLGAVVICRSELLGGRDYPAELDARAERSVRDGIAWVGRNFSVSRNPGVGGWHFYYLYGLERAGMLAGVDRMGEHDWYGEGAEFLLGRQEGSGAFPESGPLEISTCFALLFLKRGTTPVLRGALTPSAPAAGIDFELAPELSDRDFEDLVDLVVARYARAEAGPVRDELAGATTRVGARIVFPLLRRMDSPERDVRAAAHALLAAATALPLPFDPDAPPADRCAALAAWEAWYVRSSGRLRLDERRGRIVGGD